MDSSENIAKTARHTAAAKHSETKSRFPGTRLRRLRKTETLRALMRETAVTPNDLIYPLFVEEGIDAPQPVTSMPGVMRIPEKKLADEMKRIAADGIKAVMLF